MNERRKKTHFIWQSRTNETAINFLYYCCYIVPDC